MSMLHAPLPSADSLGHHAGTIFVQDTVQQVEQQTDEHHGAAEPGIDPELWVLIAFLLMLVIIARPAWRSVTTSLDRRAAKIRAELEEAQRLREEAQTALATFQRKHQESLHEAEEIIAHARGEADRARAEAAADIEQMLSRRETLAMQRIAQAEASAVSEVRNLAVDIAIAASRRLIADNTDESKAHALVDQAIAELPQKLH